MKIEITIVDEGLEEKVVLTDDQVAKFVEVSDVIGKDYPATIKKVLERGMYDVQYRHVHGQKDRELLKAAKAAIGQKR